MFSQVSVAVARLNDPSEAAAQIDHVLQECLIKSRPVYITLPTDMVQKKVEGERLKTPIDISIPKNDPDVEDYVVDAIFKYLYAAKSPTILVDACAIRHGVGLEPPNSQSN
jgi:pyruvate decarboxylase